MKPNFSYFPISDTSFAVRAEADIPRGAYRGSFVFYQSDEGHVALHPYKQVKAPGKCTGGLTVQNKSDGGTFTNLVVTAEEDVKEGALLQCNRKGSPSVCCTVVDPKDPKARSYFP